MSPTDVPDIVRQRVREAARDRCGYCLSAQRYVMGKLEVEHIVPRSRGGRDDETEGGLYLKDEYAENPDNSHPNSAFSQKVAPLFCQRIVDVIEGRGDGADEVQ